MSDNNSIENGHKHKHKHNSIECENNHKARLGVSRTIYVNVESPNLGFTYFNSIECENNHKARLGVSRTIYVNVESPNLGFTYFNFLGEAQCKKAPCMLGYSFMNFNY